MDHPIDPPRADTLEELGRRIGKLRYDALLLVLEGLRAELERQAEADFDAGRRRLAIFGSEASGSVGEAATVVAEMFHLSLPYMREEVLKRPLLRK